MDRKSWLWKKKSSQLFSDTATSQIEQEKKDEYKNSKYVQISVEAYTYFNGLEEKVTSLEEEIKGLDEKLLESKGEMTIKENLVKQHSKVADEAISGWEKAEEETDALKSQLKECMKQIRNLKEEHEQQLFDVMSTKTKQFNELKHELESNLAKKLQAEAEIEHLKCTIESNQNQMNSLQYEVQIVTKELEIRNEEKNMSIRSADVANRQHSEGLKKISKLESECQRLRNLVRKKLPGPAAIAQMKLEVENLAMVKEETKTLKEALAMQSNGEQLKCPNPNGQMISLSDDDHARSCYPGSWTTRSASSSEISYYKNNSGNHKELMDDFLEMEEKLLAANQSKGSNDDDNEFQELKSEKNTLVISLSTCYENLKIIKTQLQETEQRLGLAHKKSNSLSESYNDLERMSEKLGAEKIELQTKVDDLVNELQQERRNRFEAFCRCKVLEDQLSRIQSASSADFDAKTNKEKELADALEKLSKCQETIFLLGKQLNALSPRTESTRSHESISISNLKLKDTDHDSAFTHSESNINSLNGSEHASHRSTQSFSSDSSSKTSPGKRSRGLSRFFSTKSKNAAC